MATRRSTRRGAHNPDPSEYYALLGVPVDCTLEEIKRGYRQKALSSHPDKGGDPEVFKRVAEAYSVLSDPASRADYDSGVGVGGGASSAGHHHDVDLHFATDLFAAFDAQFAGLFGGGGFPGRGGGAPHQHPKMSAFGFGGLPAGFGGLPGLQFGAGGGGAASSSTWSSSSSSFGGGFGGGGFRSVSTSSSTVLEDRGGKRYSVTRTVKTETMPDGSVRRSEETTEVPVAGGGRGRIIGVGTQGGQARLGR